MTSKKARSALNDYLRSHPSLHDEIEKRMGVVQGVKTVSESAEDDSYDDTDVPSSAIIEDALGIAVTGADVQVTDCIVQARKDDETGGLVAADEENVWACSFSYA